MYECSSGGCFEHRNLTHQVNVAEFVFDVCQKKWAGPKGPALRVSRARPAATFALRATAAEKAGHCV